MAEREFTQTELDKFSKDYIELALEALKAGKPAEAEAYLERHNVIKNFLHDNYLRWITWFMTYIHREWGEEAAVTAIHKSIEGFSVGGNARQEAIDEGGIRLWVEQVVDIWRTHASHPGMTVEEDDEKFVISLKACGSGGQLINQGLFDGPDPVYARVEKAGPHTWGESDVPIYCTHCVQAHERSPIDRFGQGSQYWVHASPFPKKPGDACIHHIYKDASKIPASYYERLGLTKEEAKAVAGES